MMVYTIYRNPRDYPGKIVVRAHRYVPPLGAAAEPLYIGENLEAARRAIQAQMPGAVMLARDQQDDAAIVENWL